MSDTVSTFYDKLAQYYRYIFSEWHTSVTRQGIALDRILEAHGFMPANHTLYDCTCGIGTQVFGLAQRGWQVHGTDMSLVAISKAQEYLSEFEMIFTPTFAVADLLKPSDNPTQYAVVVALDNAIPHFLRDVDLLTALKTMKAHLKDNGLLMISIRDYDALIENPPRTTQPSLSDTDDGRYIIFQTWDWSDDLSWYRLNMYITQHTSTAITTQVFPAVYRALRRETLSDALSQLDFKNVQWFMPEESGFYQLIVTARI